MHDQLVYLNGELTPLSEARIPVLDRGFIFGDGVYEVIPLYRRQPFRAKQHMTRLFRSLDEIRIPNPHTEEEWMALIDKVAQAFPEDNQLVYMQVTRGVARRAHAFPKDVQPTVFIMTGPLVQPTAEQRAQGVPCVTQEDRRWLNCHIKSISLLGNVLAAQLAAEEGAVEVIQFRDGHLTEGAAANVWIVKDGKLLAPPKDHLILEGIRYGLIEELCAATGIPFEAKRITREEVMGADEVLLSSASKEVLAVSTIDGHAVGDGRPGPVCHRLHQAYRALIP